MLEVDKSLRFLLFTVATVFAQQVTQPQNFAGPSLYELIQRQNQLNNALLLNHALISNSMAANLHDNHLHPPTFNFPQQSANLALYPPQHNLYPQHMQGLLPHNLQGSSAEKLAIYDALSPMTASSGSGGSSGGNSGRTSSSSDIPPPVVSGVVQVPAPKVNSEIVYLTSENKKIKPQVLLKIKAIEKTTTFPVEETTVLSTAPATTTADQLPPSIPDVFHLLKHLNLTEEESEKLVHHVEQVVREELAKKLIETKLSAITLSPRVAPTHQPPEIPSTTVGTTTTTAELTTEAPTNDEEESEETTTNDEATSTVPETTVGPIDRSERLLDSDIPEIKLHPPKRIEDKDDVYDSIKTSETHLTVMEREEEEREALERMGAGAVPLSSTLSSSSAGTTAKIPVKVEEFDPKKVAPIPRRSFVETDSDLLALATGAPLDLSDESTAEETAYRNRFRATRPPIPRIVTKSPMPPRMRGTTPPTQFVQLASDYRARLSGTEDMNKLLKTIYENAYIQLVKNEADPRKISKPRDVQRAPRR